MLLYYLLNSVLLLLIYLVISFKWKRRRMEALAAKVPGPPALPIIGNSLTFCNIRDVQDLWVLGKKLLDDFEKITRYWLGPVLVFALSDPQYIHAVLSHPNASQKHPWYKIFTFMNSGAFSINGKEWHDLRKPLNKYFQPKLLESCLDYFVLKAEQLCEKMEKKIGAGDLDAYHMVKYYTLDIVCFTHLGGEDVNEMEENRFDFHHQLERGLNAVFQRAVKPQYYIDIIFHLSKMGRLNKETNYTINAITRHILQRRMDTLTARGIDLKSDFEVEYYTDIVIKKGMKEKLNLQEMAVVLADMVVGGSDTSSVTLAFALLFLAMHPEVQAKAYQEQVDVMGDTERTPTMKDINNMPYLAMIHKEVLRLQGIIGIARYLDDDVDIGDYVLPGGSAVFLILYKAHRDPRYWEKPHEFYPEHFLPEPSSKRPKGCYLPFSTGPRRCPGHTYSEISGKVLLSLLLRKFKFTTNLKFNEMKYKYSLMLESAVGYPVQITRRNQPVAA